MPLRNDARRWHRPSTGVRYGATLRNPDAMTRWLELMNEMIQVPGVRLSLLRSDAKKDAFEGSSIASGARSGLAAPLSLISIWIFVPSTGASALPTATIGAPTFACADLSATAKLDGS